MKTYQVTLNKPATYWLNIEVEAETPEEAMALATGIAEKSYEWDCTDPGGDVKVALQKSGIGGYAVEVVREEGGQKA